MSEDELTPEQVVIAAEGLSAIAITYFEMGEARENVRGKVLDAWRRLRAPASVLAAAANEVTRSPQPIEESVEQTGRLDSIRDLLGATLPDRQLTAMLMARQLLQELADEYS